MQLAAFVVLPHSPSDNSVVKIVPWIPHVQFLINLEIFVSFRSGQMTLESLNQSDAFLVKMLSVFFCDHLSKKLNQHLKMIYLCCLSDALGGRDCGGVSALTVLYSTEGYIATKFWQILC